MTTTYEIAAHIITEDLLYGRRTTVPSSGLSGAVPPGRTHGCSSACTAVRRRDTSRSSRPC